MDAPGPELGLTFRVRAGSYVCVYEFVYRREKWDREAEAEAPMREGGRHGKRLTLAPA